MPLVCMNTTQRGAKFISHGNLWRGLDAYEASPYIFAGAGATSVQANIAWDAFVSGRSQKDLTRFTDGKIAPSVYRAKLFRAQNTRRTVITNFRNGWPG